MSSFLITVLGFSVFSLIIIFSLFLVQMAYELFGINKFISLAIIAFMILVIGLI